MVMQIHKSLKVLETFWGGHGRNGCGQSGGGTLKLTVSEKLTDGITDFFNVDTDSQKFKADKKLFGWEWSKMGVASLVMKL